MMKKTGIIIMCIVLSSLFLHAVIAKNEQNDEFNLGADIEPFRKIFPRAYTLLVKAQFDYTYYCNNGSYPGGDNLTFQVIRLADDELVYSENGEMEPLDSHSGHGSVVDYTCYSGIRRFVSFYEAKIILNVDDSDASDNEASCYFMVIERI